MACTAVISRSQRAFLARYFVCVSRADTIAYVRRYELVVRSAPTHVYSAIAVTRRFLLGREMGDVGRATTLVHECAHTVLDAEARGCKRALQHYSDRSGDLRESHNTTSNHGCSRAHRRT